MPGGASLHVSSKREYSYSRSTTPFVVFVCITAASGGLLFGYDLGISGGVTSMDDFLLQFFPKVYKKRHNAETDNYCKFDSQQLTLFTSSLYLAGFITSFFASGVTRNYGRRVSILAGGICFLIGSVLNGAAANLGMLILGRVILGVGIGFTNQVTGINIITFYAPVIFQTLGFGSNASLYSAVILGAVFIVTTMIAAFAMDKYGRRKLFLYGGCTMFIFLALTGLLLQWKLGAHNSISKGYGVTIILLIYLFCLCFGWSWGPLAWVVPSEIFPLEIRSAGQSINISVIMFFIFVTAQAFLAMLCHLKATIFFFFAGWVLVMTVFTYKLFPETRCVPLEEISNLWKRHPYWSIYYE